MSADVRATMTRRAFAQTMALAASTAGLTVGSSSIGARRAKAATSASHRVGINLAGPTDWNTELPLSMCFARRARG